jgi:FKBP-type peptidyl-prolyl cis-trans isomerase
MVRHLTAVALLASAALPSPGAAQELLKLKPLSPIAAWRLSPTIGVPEDSLRSVAHGVWVHDLQIGSGRAAAVGDAVALHFVAFLADGTIFSATDRKPFRFTLGAGQVIDGWEDGVPGMRVGGRRQLVIPPDRGYGSRGDGPVPPDAVLVFDLTLVELAEP